MTVLCRLRITVRNAAIEWQGPSGVIYTLVTMYIWLPYRGHRDRLLLVVDHDVPGLQ